MVRVILLLCITSMFFGCATKVHTTVTMPANDDAVMQYRTVAVIPFQSNTREDITSKFESTIASVTNKGKKVYTVVDRRNVNKILQEQKFQITLADIDSVVEMGKLIGVQGLWTGSVNKNYSEARYTETRTRCQNNSCYEYTVYCTKKNATIEAEPKLISVSTGMVVYSNRISWSVLAGVCSDTSRPATKTELEIEALNKILTNFRRDIAPYELSVSLELMDNNKDIKDDVSKKQLKEGIAFAKENRLDRACDLWKQVSDKNPDAVSPAYNSALCLEVTGRYAEALTMLEKIESTLPPSGFSFLSMLSLKETPSSLVKNAIERNIKNIENMEKLKNQTSGI